MAINKRYIRQLHRKLVPIMVMPLIITVLTGTLFQVAILMGKGGDFYFLMEMHRGKFGPINLKAIYPFLNGFGLLLLITSGSIMWWTTRPKKRQTP